MGRVPCVFHWLTSWDREPQALRGSHPRTPEGCWRLCCLLSPGSHTLGPSRTALPVLGRAATASPQISFFGEPSRAKPSHYQSLNGHNFGPGHQTSSHAPELCLCHFLKRRQVR